MLPFGDSLDTVVQKSLAEVRLTESARVRAQSYSGGMKRRFSVAISLFGDPKLVILDELTCCDGCDVWVHAECANVSISEDLEVFTTTTHNAQVNVRLKNQL
ncbi:ABC transporter A family member 2-like protein [Tanacetum coccineum]